MKCILWATMLSTVAMLASAEVVAAETLQREMSDEQFDRAGLNRLTAEELEYLNRYLQRADVPQEEQFGSEQVETTAAKRQSEVSEINSSIKGEFTGWEGRTVFRLANGQIWQQRLSGRYRHRATDPEVSITRERFGYYLKIVETGRKIAVKRLK